MTRIPTLHIVADSIPQAHYRAMKAVWENGLPIRTEYDRKEDGQYIDPPSRDARVLIEITNPLNQPRYAPTSFCEIGTYIAEILGAKDHLVLPIETLKNAIHGELTAHQWPYCVHPDSLVLDINYQEKPIKEFRIGEQVLCLNTENGKLEPAKIVQVAKCKAESYEIVLTNQMNIETSEVHPLYVLGKGWVKTKDIAKGDKIATIYSDHTDFKVDDSIKPKIIVTKDDIKKIKNINHTKIIKFLTDLNLLPLDCSTRNGQIMIALAGYIFGDGWLNSPRYKKSSKYLSGRVSFNGDYSALRVIKKLLKEIGITSGAIVSIRQKTNIKEREVKGTSLYFSCNHTPLWTLFSLMGCPVGFKSSQDYQLPEWLNTSDKGIIRQFIRGFMDAESSAPYKTRDKKPHGYGIGAQIYFRQNKIVKLEESLNKLINNFYRLFKQIGIDFQKLMKLYDGKSVSYGLRISDRKNIIKYVNDIGYIFSHSKRYRTNLYKDYHTHCVKLMKKNNVKNASNLKIESFGEFCKEDINGKVFFTEVKEINRKHKKIDLIDIAVDHPCHNFIANGVACHNTYHQRLVAHPDLNGDTIDQVALAIDRLAKTPHTRRAIATTTVPNLDPHLKEDVPCLREIQFRCTEDEAKVLHLNISATWRSRDLFKAWPDNLIGLTVYYQKIANQIQEKTGRKVVLGSYAEYSSSLHIYGQDFKQVGGDSGKGLCSFFDVFTEESYLKRSLSSDDAKEMLVIPQLQNLLTDTMIEQWKFPPQSIEIIKNLIKELESGEIIA